MLFRSSNLTKGFVNKFDLKYQLITVIKKDEKPNVKEDNKKPKETLEEFTKDFKI